MGYRIANGKVGIVPGAAEIVKGIFEDYLNRTVTCRIAKKLAEQGVLNTNYGPSWNYCSVGKILGNQKCRGDDFYPALVDAEAFEQIQERHRGRTGSLGRKAQFNSHANKSLLGGRTICEVCGQPYRKYVGHCNQPGKTIRWKRKRYTRGSRVYCRNILLAEGQIEDAILATVNCFMESPDLLGQGATVLKAELKSAQSQKLTGQTQECLENG